MEDIYCFAGNPLDRVSERRDDREWIASLLGDPQTRILALRDLKPFTRGTGAPALDWQPVGPWRGHIDSGAQLIFLGLGDGLDAGRPASLHQREDAEQVLELGLDHQHFGVVAQARVRADEDEQVRKPFGVDAE